MAQKNVVVGLALTLNCFALFADSLTSGGSLAVSTAFNPTGSFWNNVSGDVVSGSNQANVGNFLAETGAFSSPVLNCPTCGVNYMAGGGQMYVNSGNTPNFVSNLNFVTQTGGLQISLLYANSGGNGFAEFGLYDASNIGNALSNHVVLQAGNTINLNNFIGLTYTSGTEFTGAVNNGTVSLSNGSPYATWGIYVRTCTEGSVSFATCNADGDVVTYYMGEPSQEGSNFTNDIAHQHFALFQAGTNANQYYAGLEDFAFTAADPNAGTNGVEGYGDYNDLIFGVTTSTAIATPEPSTLFGVGLGITMLCILGRRRRT